jgi:hypothetical protein
MPAPWAVPALICLLLLASACADSSPTAPDAVQASGTWTGTYQIVTCQGGVDPRSCGRFPSTGGLSLRLSQTQSQVTGTLTIDVPSPESTNIASLTASIIPVAGTVSTNNELRLSGSTVLKETPLGPESARLTEWTTTLRTDGLTGRIVLVTAGFYQGSLPQTFQITSDLNDVKRTASAN